MLQIFRLATYRTTANSAEKNDDNVSLHSKRAEKQSAKNDSVSRYTKKSKTILNQDKFLKSDTIKTFLLYVFFVVSTVALNTIFSMVVRVIMLDS